MKTKKIHKAVGFISAIFAITIPFTSCESDDSGSSSNTGGTSAVRIFTLSSGNTFFGSFPMITSFLEVSANQEDYSITDTNGVVLVVSGQTLKGSITAITYADGTNANFASLDAESEEGNPVEILFENTSTYEIVLSDSSGTPITAKEGTYSELE